MALKAAHAHDSEIPLEIPRTPTPTSLSPLSLLAIVPTMLALVCSGMSTVVVPFSTCNSTCRSHRERRIEVIRVGSLVADVGETARAHHHRLPVGCCCRRAHHIDQTKPADRRRTEPDALPEHPVVDSGPGQRPTSSPW